MGIFSVGITVAPTLGPVIGGILLDAFNWHYVFFMSVPIAVVGILLAMVFMPSAVRKGPLPTFDWAGLVLVTLFISCTLTGLSNGLREGWGTPIIAVLFLPPSFPCDIYYLGIMDAEPHFGAAGLF